MQPIVHYQYPVDVELVLSLNELPGTGYAMIYSRLLKINKFVTNQYRFTIHNQDQKPINLLDKTLTFDLINRDTGALVISKYLTDGKSNGQITLTLLESDTLNLDTVYYSYNLHLVDEQYNKLPLYTGFNYETSGYAEVVDTNFGRFVASQTLDAFTLVTGSSTVYQSYIADANPLSNGNIALHTVAVYGTNYTGVLNIKGTLANDVDPGQEKFFDIRADGQASVDIELTNFTGLAYYNFYGVFRKVQFLHTPNISNTGNIDKIVYRY